MGFAPTTEHRGGGRHEHDRATLELIERARSVAIELDELLAKLRIMGAANVYSVRLAQAHALSVLDQLSRLLGSDRSDR